MSYLLSGEKSNREKTGITLVDRLEAHRVLGNTVSNTSENLVKMKL